IDKDRALRLLKADCLPSGVQLVKCSWLSKCIGEKELFDPSVYSLFHIKSSKYLFFISNSETQKCCTNNDTPKVEPVAIQANDAKEAEHTKSAASDSKEVPQGDDDGVSQSDLEALMTGHHPINDSPGSDSVPQMAISGKWVCAQSSESKSNNFNKHITDKLEVLAKAYSHQGDKWRALSYSKAVNALKSYHKPVTSYQEACQIPGIGTRMADKIDEIMESGHLRKLDHIGEAVPVLEMFTNIWGAGAKTAQLWYQQGFRTLEDISTKAHLNHNQKIGLKYYNDFLTECLEMNDAARAVDPGLVSLACGSYRRGKATCGDVDVLITHPDGKSHKGIFSKILQNLHESGLILTDDLVSNEENGEQKKYMGVCRLPGPNQLHRRLDIIVVPYDEFACALMYFTGSAHFNRSLRALAKTKQMSLSEHSLNKDVMRQGSLKVHGGTSVPTLTEKDVFNVLGVPYRQPHERDW
uniref:DNA polymerase n=1 Tax=Neogobius melanostomus TaxID=47308 RepID=A0A8C6US17_9GOBI